MARPTEKTEDTIQKLEQAFMDGATVLTACEIAGIGSSTFYDWLKDDEEFSERMEIARNYIDSIARINIARAVKKEEKTGETEESKWWAERRMKSEFSKRTDITSEGERIQGVKIYKPSTEDDE